MKMQARRGRVALTGLIAAALATTVAGGAFAGSLPASLVAGAAIGQYGTIKGRLVYGGEKAPAAKVLVPVGGASKDPSVCASKTAIVSDALNVDPKTLGIEFGVAYLVRPKGSNPEAAKKLLEQHPTVEIDQKNCRFTPYTTAMFQDQSIKFKSTDPVGHNVHMTGFNNSFNQMIAAGSQIEQKVTAERRAVTLTCDIHPWMLGYIWIFDHPFFAMTKADGSFEITGVPAGTQNLVVWQGSVGYATPKGASGVKVEVKAGEVTDVGDIKLDPSKVK